MGWNNIFQVEINKFCQKVLNKNFPETKKYFDIKEFNGNEYKGTIDVISGGFPCQPFSIAGKQGGEEDNRYLWPEMLRVISEVRPTFVVGENVFGIVSISLDQVLSDLEAQGYTTETFIVPACSVNAPHRRDRVWIIGYTKHAGFDATENGKGSNERSNGNTKGQNEICEPARPTLSRDASTNLNGKRLQGEQEARNIIESRTETEQRFRKHIEGWDKSWIEVASELCRVDDGIPNRVDRIKGLGNAIVPQVAFELFKAIQSVHRQRL